MANMDGLRRSISEFVEKTAAEALEITFRETVDAAPEATGALRQKIDTDSVRMSGDFVAEARIFCTADYAEYTDGGSEPHRIYGRPWLAFEWGGVDVVFFERDGGPAYVNHPGSPGTRWFNSGNDGGEPMRSRWEDALVEAAR